MIIYYTKTYKIFKLLLRTSSYERGISNFVIKEQITKIIKKTIENED